MYDAFGRRKRISQLEAVVLENPSAGNYEELGDLYLEEEKFARARECYDKAISPRTTHLDPIYRRGVAAIHLNDFGAAVPTSSTSRRASRSTTRIARSHSGTRLCQQRSGREADALFRHATEMSTLSETYLNYATFLASQNRAGEARQWAERILAKKPTMPRYLKRRERPWFRKASAVEAPPGLG